MNQSMNLTSLLLISEDVTVRLACCILCKMVPVRILDGEPNILSRISIANTNRNWVDVEERLHLNTAVSLNLFPRLSLY
jgi:hypothetical protein